MSTITAVRQSVHAALLVLSLPACSPVPPMLFHSGFLNASFPEIPPLSLVLGPLLLDGAAPFPLVLPLVLCMPSLRLDSYQVYSSYVMYFYELGMILGVDSKITKHLLSDLYAWTTR